MFRSFDRFKGDCPLGAWIYRIATNEALCILEQRSRKGTRLTLDDPSAGTTQMIADGYVDYSDLESIKLQKAILALPTKQQLAFNLRYYDELDYDEIASHHRHYGSRRKSQLPHSQGENNKVHELDHLKT